MGTVHDGIDDGLRDWIERQHVVFVATAPSDPSGLVNLSPKGMVDTFTVVDRHRCAYLDLTGSGIETVAHLRDNGRITVMWCAFEGPPRIVRVHGTGRGRHPRRRSVGRRARRVRRPAGRPAVDRRGHRRERVSDSCGYSVPLMEFVGERDRLVRWTESRTDEELDQYRRDRNAVSVDGLPAFD
jgi:hypothetical protein